MRTRNDIHERFEDEEVWLSVLDDNGLTSEEFDNYENWWNIPEGYAVIQNLKEQFVESILVATSSDADDEFENFLRNYANWDDFIRELSQCTIDAARILRVPETLNLKNGEQKPVKLLSLGTEVSYDAMHTALSKYIGQGPFENGAFITSSNPIKIEANDELGANLESKKVEIRLEDVAKS